MLIASDEAIDEPDMLMPELELVVLDESDVAAERVGSDEVVDSCNEMLVNNDVSVFTTIMLVVTAVWSSVVSLLGAVGSDASVVTRECPLSPSDENLTVHFIVIRSFCSSCRDNSYDNR